MEPVTPLPENFNAFVNARLSSLVLLCVSGSEGQLTPAHDILFWDQIIETDQSRFFVLRRILFGFSVISIHAKPFDSDPFSGAEFEKCSPICQQRTVKPENRRLIRACRSAGIEPRFATL